MSPVSVRRREHRAAHINPLQVNKEQGNQERNPPCCFQFNKSIKIKVKRRTAGEEQTHVRESLVPVITTNKKEITLTVTTSGRLQDLIPDLPMQRDKHSLHSFL